MATKTKHGLGRGLDALLAPAEPQEDSPREISIHLIDPNPDQPRKQIDEDKLAELAQSIQTHGVLQPILVVERQGRYAIVAGERRWRAARLAGLSSVPVLVRRYTPQQISEIALVENLQRADLNPLDEARGIQSLIETFHLTQEQVGERLSMSRPAVTNSLRLLSLPPAIQESMRRGAISAGHGRTLLGLSDQPTKMLELAQQTEAQNLSVRELEALVSRAHQDAGESPKNRREADPDEFGDLEERLMQALGTQVKVYGSLKKGKIVIQYYDKSDLERIYDLAVRLTQA
jgi:ParB family chromosome partitioning protein